MSALKLTNLSKRFGGVVASENVNIEVPAGKITGLIGPNGAGKTTIVNMITGMLPVSGGHIHVGETDITHASAHEISRAGLARTFQNIRLLGEATVLENVMIGFHRHETSSTLAALIGLPSAGRETEDVRQRALLLLDEFDLRRFADYPANGLSYGHQRKVEMARAMAAEPDFVLLDEPIAGMNDVESDALADIFRRLAASGKGVLLIEHNVRFVSRMCSYVYVLDGGRLISEGTPDHVLNDPAVISAYLGISTMLEVRDLKVGYSGIQALRGVSLDVAQGEIVALIGPNGAGKSSLLNTISGVVRPQSGSVTFEGSEIAGSRPWVVTKRGILQVPEGRKVFAEMTVLENLQVGETALHGRAPTYRLEDVYKVFPILQERQDQRAGSLSGGQQQMLVIGRALMGGPQLLLLDEPSLGLAPVIIAQVFEALAQLNAQGLTILLIEQNAHLALTASNRAYVIEQGRIMKSGASKDLAQDPEVTALYLGQD